MAGTAADAQARPHDLQCLIREATLILQEPLEAMASPLRTYRKRVQVLKKLVSKFKVFFSYISSTKPR